jgi:hypothetical protein
MIRTAIGFFRKRSAAAVCPSSWRKTDESTPNAYARGEAQRSKKRPAAANGWTEMRDTLFKLKIPFRGGIFTATVFDFQQLGFRQSFPFFVL